MTTNQTLEAKVNDCAREMEEARDAVHAASTKLNALEKDATLDQRTKARTALAMAEIRVKHASKALQALINTEGAADPAIADGVATFQ